MNESSFTHHLNHNRPISRSHFEYAYEAFLEQIDTGGCKELKEDLRTEWNEWWKNNG